MPDLDILYTRAVHGWYPPARLAKGNAPPAEIADAIIKSLAKELRRGNGLPKMKELCTLLWAVAEGAGRMLTGFDQLREIENSMGSDLHARIACRAARGVLVELAQGTRGRVGLERYLAAEYCQHLIQNRFFGRVRPVLVGESFADAAAVQVWEEAVLLALAPSLDQLVDRLVANPTAHKLRAPKHRVPRRSTAELLDQPLFSE